MTALASWNIRPSAGRLVATLVGLPKRLGGGTLGVILLPSRIAFFGKVASAQDFTANRAGGKPRSGGVARPGQVGAMQVAAVARIACGIPLAASVQAMAERPALPRCC